MSQYDGILIRSSLTDTGAIPRTGPWTGSPDIIPSGVTAMSQNDLISKYGQYLNNPLSQGLINYLYVRGKNLSSTTVKKRVYLFQVPGSLVLFPDSWYSESNLILHNGEPYQVLTAASNQIVATNAFTWKPQTTEHHCMVTVLADSWEGIQEQFPPDINTNMNDLANWIYENGNIGWHNVSIQAMTTRVMEKQIPFANTAGDVSMTFTIVAQNVPVGAKVSFSADQSTSSGDTIAVGWTTVSAKPGAPDPNINSDFEVGTTITVNQHYSGTITYRTEFSQNPSISVPENFKMHMKATYSAAPNPSLIRKASKDFASGLFEMTYRNSFTRDALFVHPRTGDIVSGFEGYKHNLDLDDSLEPQIAVVVGSDSVFLGGK